MKTNARQLLAATALGLLAFTSNRAQAQVTTGSLSGWNVLGDVVVQGGAITLTTAFADGDPAGDQPFKLTNTGTGAVSIGELETAAGVAPLALDLSATEYGTEGSLIGQSFAAIAGQTLSFVWAFGTRETLFQDRAFVVIDGVVTTLATAGAAGAASQTFNYTFGRTGDARLAFGVIDTGDVVGVSSLTVGHLQLTVAAVPEPAAGALLLAGLGVLGVVARRRRCAVSRRGAALPDRAR